MPWKECHIMDERLRFFARLLEGQKMAPSGCIPRLLFATAMQDGTLVKTQSSAP